MRTRRGNARRAPSVAASEQPQPPRPRARRSLAPGNPDRGAVAVPTAAAAEVTVDRPPVGTSGAGDFVGIGSPSRLVAGPLLSAHRPPGPASRAPSRAPSCAPSSASAMQRDAVMQAITSMQAQLAQLAPLAALPQRVDSLQEELARASALRVVPFSTPALPVVAC